MDAEAKYKPSAKMFWLIATLHQHVNVNSSVPKSCCCPGRHRYTVTTQMHSDEIIAGGIFCGIWQVFPSKIKLNNNNNNNNN